MHADCTLSDPRRQIPSPPVGSNGCNAVTAAVPAPAVDALLDRFQEVFASLLRQPRNEVLDGIEGYVREGEEWLRANLVDAPSPDTRGAEVLIASAKRRVVERSLAFLGTRSLCRLLVHEPEASRLTRFASMVAQDQGGFGPYGPRARWRGCHAVGETIRGNPKLAFVLDAIHAGPVQGVVALLALQEALPGDRLFLLLVPECLDETLVRVRDNSGSAEGVKRALDGLASNLAKDQDWTMRAWLRTHPEIVLRGCLGEIPWLADFEREHPRLFGATDEERTARIANLLNRSCELDEDADPSEYCLGLSAAEDLAVSRVDFDRFDQRAMNTLLDEWNDATDDARAAGRPFAATMVSRVVDQAQARLRHERTRPKATVRVRSRIGRPYARARRHTARRQSSSSRSSDGDATGGDEGGPPDPRHRPLPSPTPRHLHTDLRPPWRVFVAPTQQRLAFIAQRGLGGLAFLVHTGKLRVVSPCTLSSRPELDRQKHLPPEARRAAA